MTKNVKQTLLDARINIWAIELLAESLLKSPLIDEIAKIDDGLKFFFPINRSDCAAWVGVEITLKPIAASTDPEPNNPPPSATS
ncbi:hypothetical protein KFZ76_11965 [Methylovulum psychrotolerans]|uniref:hypothetical protein n=1 Tax=Methylovulum psychrotolerans TaxID=1704499 RepID=UPI001BFFA2A0|nr:hypothetical protein [Methylovulum psychrotolerans]MBT9098423.1 hypothetical protein [Methylovulum psychrotolerans]